MRRSEGFSFIELMIVVAILGVVSSVGVGGVQRVRRDGNSVSAVDTARTVHGAEITYQAGVGNSSFGSSPNLYEKDLIDRAIAAALGVDVRATPTRPCDPVPCADSLSGGRAFGYMFSVKLFNDLSGLHHFQITAEPAAPGRSGDETFWMDDASDVVHVACRAGQTTGGVAAGGTAGDAGAPRCGPDDTVLTVKGLNAIRALDALGNGTIVPGARRLVADPAFVAAVLAGLDADGDGRLSFSEILDANVRSLARRLRNAVVLPDSRGSVRNEEVDRIVDEYLGGVRRDLALGIAGESLPTVPLADLHGDPSLLFRFLR